MSNVSFSPSYVNTMLFVTYSEIWAPLILAQYEGGQRFIAFVAKEMVGEWELLRSLQLYIYSVKGYDLPLFYLNSLGTGDLFIRCHSLKEDKCHIAKTSSIIQTDLKTLLLHSSACYME